MFNKANKSSAYFILAIHSQGAHCLKAQLSHLTAYFPSLQLFDFIYLWYVLPLQSQKTMRLSVKHKQEEDVNRCPMRKTTERRRVSRQNREKGWPELFPLDLISRQVFLCSYRRNAAFLFLWQHLSVIHLPSTFSSFPLRNGQNF